MPSRARAPTGDGVTKAIRRDDNMCPHDDVRSTRAYDPFAFDRDESSPASELVAASDWCTSTARLRLSFMGDHRHSHESQCRGDMVMSHNATKILFPANWHPLYPWVETKMSGV
jgi:hypothetical protein